jgi:hypothetical protein
MNGSLGRFTLALGASALLGLALASSSSAALTSSLIDDELRLTSDDLREKNQALIEIGDNGLEFRDLKAGVSAGVCPVSGGAIVCGPILNGVSRFRISLRAGNDLLQTFDPRLIGLPRVKALMGSGDDQVSTLFTPVDADLGQGDDFAHTSLLADVVKGGGGVDQLEPGPGDDFVDGGAGDDLLRGGFRRDVGTGRSDGRDTLLGGDGKDKVLAKDFTKDKRIDCGAGRDALRRDRFDPRPKRCE